ncbi:MAG: polyamine aminopropyltransferase [Aigarchaeota archaeon]|nr:polyamine aminopropyltransferase [Aigarchaeota archaeon]MCX8192590.1 polyamine aminopropyltransferase [Nitrososphaeria archaeon]MDW7985674.1 polyamine aminopropyltransferase [Nitrososphaerota archaeon]
MTNTVEPSIYVMEKLSPSLRVIYGIKRIVYSGKTKHQKVDIVETEDYGLSLLLDGLMQSSEIDENIYHECLVHPSLIAHPNPKKVLVIGGGEGSTIREVEKHSEVEEITMVDLDGELIDIVKKHIPWSLKAFEDERLKLIISEGRRFLEEQSDNRYDVVIVDVTDPVEGGPAIKLYTLEFYQVVYRKLRENGIIVTQASSISHTPSTFISIYRTISQIFPRTCYYGCFIKSFLSLWGFVVGSKSVLPSDLQSEEVDNLLREKNINDLRFYSGAVHTSIFKLVDVYLKFYKGLGKVIKDSDI